MSGVTPTRRSPGGKRPAPATRLRVEPLEDRATPATDLLTSAYGNASALSTGGELLGASSDGRYVVFQSTAGNVVQNQTNIFANSTNLFWEDTFTGETRLVSAAVASNGTNAVGVTPSVPGQTANAVISGDGQTVAFVSKANASRLDGTFNQTFGLNQLGDNGDASDDVFAWNVGVARSLETSIFAGNQSFSAVTLVSREFFGSNGAVGLTSSATNPAVSDNGTRVSFVTSRSAAAFALLTNDNGDFTPDLFVSTLTGVPASTVSGGASPSSNDLSAGIPDCVTQFSDPVSFGGRSAFGRYTGFVQVDPLGRYMSGDGQSFAVVSNLTPNRIDQTSPISTAGAQEVYLIQDRQTNVVFGVNRVISLMTSAPGLSNQSVGAIATNAIVPRGNGNAVVFSASVPGGTNSLVPGYVNQNGAGADLYYRDTTGLPTAVGNTTVGVFGNVNAAVLLSAQSGTTSSGSNGALDVTPGSFSSSDDGTVIAFTSAATNLTTGTDTNGVNDIFVRNRLAANGSGLTTAASVTGAGATAGNGASSAPRLTSDGGLVAFVSAATNLVSITDTNNATDVFVRDLILNQTGAVSVANGGGSTGNAKSFAVVVGGSKSAGVVGFTSVATDIVLGFTFPAGVNQAYSTTLPLALPAVGSVVAVAGGVSGQAALATFAADGSLVAGAPITPFPGFSGAVRAASADVTGDGVPDLIVGAGPGGSPLVKVYDGATGALVYSFLAFEASFAGGVYVAGGDFNADGKADIVVGAGEGGGPRVRVFNATNAAPVFDVFVYESTFRGGVRVATGDVNGDGTTDLVTAAGEGGGPRISAFDGKNLPALTVLVNFFAFEASLRNGAYVNTGDVTGDGKADIVTGAGPDGAPRVILFDANALLNPSFTSNDGKLADFYAFPSSSRDGVRVALKNVNGNSAGGIVAGIGGGGAQVRTFALNSLAAALTPQQLSSTFPLDETAGLFGAYVG